MASLSHLSRPTLGSQANIVYAFIERQTNLWKRYWAWEIVWLVYGVVNTLAVTFIANEVGRTGIADPAQVRELVIFLLAGSLVWAYLSAVLDDVSLVITWERWEGTIEHTLMAPVSRSLHLLGMALFGVLHAIIRTGLIMLLSLPFFSVDLGNANWLAVMLIVALGSVSIVGIAILGSVLPLLYPERGIQMAFMIQAVILLVSGVYYNVEVLPGWLQIASEVSPATYILDGIRAALIDGAAIGKLQREFIILAILGAALVPASLIVFALAERWAKQTGQLKRQG